MCVCVCLHSKDRRKKNRECVGVSEYTEDIKGERALGQILMTPRKVIYIHNGIFQYCICSDCAIQWKSACN